VTGRDRGVTGVTSYVNVEKNLYEKKEPSLQEEAAASARVKLSPHNARLARSLGLDPAQMVKFLWFQARLKQAVDEAYPQATYLLEQMPDERVVLWCNEMASPPGSVTHHLEVLDRRRRSAQANLLLTIPGARREDAA
jgi:hypothetical protein